ncbi:hypothetical protein ACJX0J_031633, partial [Zea mays]
FMTHLEMFHKHTGSATPLSYISTRTIWVLQTFLDRLTIELKSQISHSSPTHKDEDLCLSEIYTSNIYKLGPSPDTQPKIIDFLEKAATFAVEIFFACCCV